MAFRILLNKFDIMSSRSNVVFKFIFSNSHVYLQINEHRQAHHAPYMNVEQWRAVSKFGEELKKNYDFIIKRSPIKGPFYLCWEFKIPSHWWFEATNLWSIHCWSIDQQHYSIWFQYQYLNLPEGRRNIIQRHHIILEDNHP